MQTVAETLLFIAQAAKLFPDAELKAIIDTLAFNPEAGELIQGTGGIREVRVALSE